MLVANSCGFKGWSWPTFYNSGLLGAPGTLLMVVCFLEWKGDSNFFEICIVPFVVPENCWWRRLSRGYQPPNCLPSHVSGSSHLANNSWKKCSCHPPRKWPNSLVVLRCCQKGETQLGRIWELDLNLFGLLLATHEDQQSLIIVSHFGPAPNHIQLRLKNTNNH